MKLFEITFTLNPEFHSLPTHIFLPGSLFWPFLSASSFPPIVIFLSNTSYLHFTLPTRLFYPSLDLFLPMTLPTCLFLSASFFPPLDAFLSNISYPAISTYIWGFHQSLPTLLLTSSYLTLPTQLFLPMTLPTYDTSYPPLHIGLFLSSSWPLLIQLFLPMMLPTCLFLSSCLPLPIHLFLHMMLLTCLFLSSSWPLPT